MESITQEPHDFNRVERQGGGEIKIDDYITIYQPTIRQIIEYGENRFWTLVHQVCGNTTSMRVMLWQAGINWNKISDWELFISMIRSVKQEDSEILFGDLDFTKFVPVPFTEEEDEDPDQEKDEKDKKEKKPKVILIHFEKPEIQIDEEKYNQMMSYLRIMCNFQPKKEFTKSKLTAESIIEEEIQNARAQERVNAAKGIKPKWQPSILFSLISGCVNHPAFKYKRVEVLDMPIFEFFDSVQRLRVYDNSAQLGLGRFMLIDTSSLDLNKELNWARDMYQE